jgi:hypothetical protein
MRKICEKYATRVRQGLKMRFMKELRQIDGDIFRKIVVENVCIEVI